ncbi:hypothetical protein WDD9_001762, partial [Paenibacillus melissococcoides]|uniref:hypothetical protein n=1 Tax=Paenibacillus melissococcoides TaxID=2912268 RepID=UPI0021C260A1
GPFRWTDRDDACLRLYVERVLGFRSETAIRDAVTYAAEANARNPVAEYLEAQEWDGVPRLDSVYIDYFGRRIALLSELSRARRSWLLLHASCCRKAQNSII